MAHLKEATRIKIKARFPSLHTSGEGRGLLPAVSISPGMLGTVDTYSVIENETVEQIHQIFLVICKLTFAALILMLSLPH